MTEKSSTMPPEIDARLASIAAQMATPDAETQGRALASLDDLLASRPGFIMPNECLALQALSLVLCDQLELRLGEDDEKMLVLLDRLRQAIRLSAALPESFRFSTLADHAYFAGRPVGQIN